MKARGSKRSEVVPSDQGRGRESSTRPSSRQRTQGQSASPFAPVADGVGEIAALPFLRRLEGAGWKRVSVEDGGVTTEHWRTFGRLTLTIRYRAMTVRKTWMKPEDKTSVLGLEAKSRGRVVSITELDPGVFSSNWRMSKLRQLRRFSAKSRRY